jgi:hypothetical protein
MFQMSKILLFGETTLLHSLLTLPLQRFLMFQFMTLNMKNASEPSQMRSSCKKLPRVVLQSLQHVASPQQHQLPQLSATTCTTGLLETYWEELSPWQLSAREASTVSTVTFASPTQSTARMAIGKLSKALQSLNIPNRSLRFLRMSSKRRD